MSGTVTGKPIATKKTNDQDGKLMNMMVLTELRGRKKMKITLRDKKALKASVMCNVAVGSNISLQQSHKHKHTN